MVEKTKKINRWTVDQEGFRNPLFFMIVHAMFAFINHRSALIFDLSSALRTFRNNGCLLLLLHPSIKFSDGTHLPFPFPTSLFLLSLYYNS